MAEGQVWTRNPRVSDPAGRGQVQFWPRGFADSGTRNGAGRVRVSNLPRRVSVGDPKLSNLVKKPTILGPCNL